MPDLSPEARQHLAHLGRKQVNAFLTEALRASELWQTHTDEEAEKDMATDVRAFVREMLDVMSGEQDDAHE